MKKFILATLIGATILTPVAASAQERGQWRNRSGESRDGSERSQRQSGREDRQQREAQPAPQPQPQAPQPQRRGWAEMQSRPQVQPPQAQRQAVPPAAVQQQRGDWRQRQDGQRRDGDRRDWQGQRQGDGQRRDWQGQRQRDGERRDWQGQRQGDRQTRGWRDLQDGRRDGQYRRGRGDNRDWSRNWRQDRRYDWGGYRQRNRNIYRLPRYYAPSGWNYGYRRFSIGLTLGSMLFAPSYWINDPFYYRLPPAYGPYRWVRYYNDALLVDIDTGEVVDVEYNIFW